MVINFSNSSHIFSFFNGRLKYCFMLLVLIPIVFLISCTDEKSENILDNNTRYTIINKYLSEKVNNVIKEFDVLYDIIPDSNNLSSVEMKMYDFKFGVPDTLNPLNHEKTEFNNSGYPTFKQYFRFDKSAFIKYIYDNNNNLIEEECYLFNQNRDRDAFVIKFEYNSAGKLTKYEKYTIANADSTSLYKLNPRSPKWSKYINFRTPGVKYHSDVDIVSHQFSKFVNNEKKIRFKQVKFSYDDNNNILEIKCYSTNGELSEKCIFEYDNNNIKSFNKFEFLNNKNTDNQKKTYSISLINKEAIHDYDIPSGNKITEIFNNNLITTYNNYKDTIYLFSFDSNLNVIKKIDVINKLVYEYKYDLKMNVNMESIKNISTNTDSLFIEYKYNPYSLIFEKIIYNNLKEIINKIKYEYQNNLISSITEYDALNNPIKITLFSYKFNN